MLKKICFKRYEMSFGWTKLENELTKLSKNLIPSDEDLDEGKRNATKLFELLERRSKFKIDRVGVFGSIKKKTSIKVDFDFDCVVYVNDVLPPYEKLVDDVSSLYEKVIDDFENVLILAENWYMKIDISRSPNSIRVMIDNVKYDIVPAINFSQNPREQRDQVIKRIKQLKYPARQGYKFSSSMDETQAEFIRDQSEFAHNFIRLAKFWNKTLFVKGNFSGRSYMIEVMALHAAKEEERTFSTVSILTAFRKFLESMKNLNSVMIVFEKYYKIGDVDEYILKQRPLVLDPANPYNNLAYPFIKTYQIRKSFEKFATETIHRLAMYNAIYNLNVNTIFNPQPTQVPIEEVRKSVPAFENWAFQIKEEISNKRPNLIIRNEKRVDISGIEIIKHYLLKNISVFNNDIKTKNVMQDEIVKIVSHDILNESFSRELGPTDKKHEDYDVTFEIPSKNFVVIVSIKWN